MDPKLKEEYTLPPDEPRYNLPDTAGYRKPLPTREEKKPAGFRGGGLGPAGF